MWTWKGSQKLRNLQYVWIPLHMPLPVRIKLIGCCFPSAREYVNPYIPTQSHEEDWKVTICNHQADHPLYGTFMSDLVICKLRKIWSYMTQKVLTETSCLSTTDTTHKSLSTKLFELNGEVLCHVILACTRLNYYSSPLLIPQTFFPTQMYWQSFILWKP